MPASLFYSCFCHVRFRAKNSHTQNNTLSAPNALQESQRMQKSPNAIYSAMRQTAMRNALHYAAKAKGSNYNTESEKIFHE